MRNPRHLQLAIICFVLALACLWPMACQAQTTALILGNVADLASTEYALKHNPNVYEANPMMQTTTRRVLAKVVGTAVQVWGVKVLGKRHPRAAKLVGYAVAGSLMVVAVRNTQLGSR